MLNFGASKPRVKGGPPGSAPAHTEIINIYRPTTKLRENNVFTGVCPSTGGGGMDMPGPGYLFGEESLVSKF